MFILTVVVVRLMILSSIFFVDIGMKTTSTYLQVNFLQHIWLVSAFSIRAHNKQSLLLYQCFIYTIIIITISTSTTTTTTRNIATKLMPNKVSIQYKVALKSNDNTKNTIEKVFSNYLRISTNIVITIIVITIIIKIIIMSPIAYIFFDDNILTAFFTNTQNTINIKTHGNTNASIYKNKYINNDNNNNNNNNNSSNNNNYNDNNSNSNKTVEIYDHVANNSITATIATTQTNSLVTYAYDTNISWSVDMFNSSSGRGNSNGNSNGNVSGSGSGSGSSSGNINYSNSNDNDNSDNYNNNNNDNFNSFYFYETEQFAVLWILFIVIVLGNSAVLFVMFMNKNRKSRMNYFIKQLAIADLFVGLLHVLTDIVWHITVSWRAGNIACKLIRFSQVCVTYSSTYVLVAMSIDRYDAITHPMNFSKSWRRARYLVAAAWIISAIFALPILLLYEEKLVQGKAQCWIELGSPLAWQIYMSLVAATLFAFPAIIISACYTIIVKTIWSKGSMFVSSSSRGGFITESNTRRASSRGNIPKAKVKTIKMTFVIVIVFIVCWSPYIIFDLLQVFGHIPQSQTNIAIATFIQSLAPLNSAANPLIYCLFSSTVFRTFSRLPPFKWLPCCCKTYRQNSCSTQQNCNTVGKRLHYSCDSMRTLTTSLTVSRRSHKTNNTHIMLCERPKSHSMDHNALSQL